ncbi:MAG: DUF4292 domain-containing protein [Candidatus Brocadiales bacterium]|nr:DUF4292 domain-containing protein [Candidatus Bathyanammoxibius sp.]MCQ4574502.1 DUF4292 domain-containing protein [Candidatus Bathyanammoxibius amoris]
MRHSSPISPFLITLATLLAGCAAMEHIALGPPKVLTVKEVRETVASNSRKISTLKAKAKVTFMSRELKEPLSCTAYIRLERPKRLRIIVSKLFQTVFNILSDGHEFWLYVPKEKKLYRGLSNQDITYMGLKFSPNEIAGILELENITPNATVRSFEVLPKYWHISLIDSQALVRYELTVDRYNLNVTNYDIYNPDGSLRMRARFDDFEDVDGCDVPRTIDVYWPRGETKLTLRLKNISINEELNPKIFRFTMPKNVNVIRLSKRRKTFLPGDVRDYTRIMATVNIR